jgi:hypothetical protein
MSGNVKAWVAEQQGRHFCKCGCGEVIVVKRHHYFRGVPALRPAHGKKKPLDARFWEKVLKTESCWIWTASKDTHGYGKVRYGGKNIRAHAFRASPSRPVRSPRLPQWRQSGMR